MSQTYPTISPTQSLASSLAPILQRDDSNRANFAGTQFPSNPAPVVGQHFWHLGQRRLYRCTAVNPLQTWEVVFDQGVADGRYVRTSLVNNFVAGQTIAGNLIWHAGNDGAGSGLDADLLDGLNSAAFGQISQNNTWTGRNLFQAAWDGTNPTLNLRSGAAGSSALVAFGRVTNEWLFGLEQSDQTMRAWRWNGSTWAENFRIEANGRLWTPFHGFLDATFFARTQGVWLTDAGGTSRFFFGGAGDGNSYYRSGAGHLFRNSADANILTLDNARWATFSRGLTTGEGIFVNMASPTVYLTHTPNSLQWWLHNNGNLAGLGTAGGGFRFTVDQSGNLWSAAYGSLHDAFFNWCDTVDVISGSGGFLSLPDIYLQDNGGNIRLVRARTRFDCNCDCNCNCSTGQCVVAGTQVQMADGSMKAVEDLVPGDEVEDADGRKALVAGLHRVPLGNRRLLLVNGVGISSDHPLLGPHGWVAADPEATKKAQHVRDTTPAGTAVSAYDAASEAVGLLETGTLVRGDFGYFPAEVVEVASADPAQTLYSPILHGAGTFVAGGLVHGALRLSHTET